MTSFASRVKSLNGGSGDGIQTLTPATTTIVPSVDSVYYLSGSATITTLDAEVSSRGRSVLFIQISGTTVFTNTAGTTTAGQMRVASSGDLNLVAGDACELFLTDGGWWVRIGSADNSA